jgi:hypothetical protein
VGGALLLTLAGKAQFHSFSRRNHHRDQRRGPRRHRRSGNLRTPPNLAFHVLWPRLLGPLRHPIAGPQRVRHPSRMVVALCRRFRIPGNPTYRSSLDLSNHFGRRASPPTPSRRLKFSSAPMPSGFSSIAWVPAAGLVRTLHDLSWYPAISYSKLICLPSRASSFFLIGSPPPKPVRLPSLPMTRWHGMMMGIGFEPFANPTARSALGLPMR